MYYIDEILVPGENIVSKAQVSVKSFIGTYIFSSLLLLSAFFYLVIGEFISSLVFVWIAGLLLFRVFVIRFSTEVALTNKRVIVKKGLFTRKTIELKLSKIESFKVDQGIFGRMLNYGTLVLSGTGSSASVISDIDNPQEFQKLVVTAVGSHSDATARKEVETSSN